MAHLLSKKARDELSDIWAYVQRDSGSDAIADALTDSITRRFLLLAAHPHLGRVRDYDLREGLRSYPVGEYIIIYRADAEGVVILRVFHGKRNIAKLFGY